MTLPRNFCCGRLRTGALVLGWIEVFSSIVIFFGSLHGMVSTEAFIPMGENPAEIKRKTLTISSLVIAASILLCVVNILLIWGSYKKKPVLIIPWLSLHIAALATVAGGLLYAGYKFLALGLLGYTFILVILGGAIFALLLYFVLCMLSLHKEMSDEINNMYRIYDDEHVNIQPKLSPYFKSLMF